MSIEFFPSEEPEIIEKDKLQIWLYILNLFATILFVSHDK